MTTTTMSNKKHRTTVSTRYVAVTGVLTAVAVILQYIEFPIPLMPSFIKLDLSDFPALIGAFTMGPVYGIVIELLKNLIHSLVGSSFGVGELSNFILGAVFTGVAGLLYRQNKTKRGAIIASVAGAVVMALISYPSNVFVVYPVYYNFMPKETILAAYQAILPSMQSVEESILIFNVPFTFVKGMLDVAITFLLYKRLSPIIKGTAR